MLKVTTAADIINITFNSGTKVFKNGDLTFPLKDIKVDSDKYFSKLIYKRSGVSAKTLGVKGAEIIISPRKIIYEEIRAEKGWKVVKQSFTFRGTIMNNDKTLPNQDVTRYIDYECSIPPNFNYKYVRT